MASHSTAATNSKDPFEMPSAFRESLGILKPENYSRLRMLFDKENVLVSQDLDAEMTEVSNLTSFS